MNFNLKNWDLVGFHLNVNTELNISIDRILLILIFINGVVTSIFLPPPPSAPNVFICGGVL